MAAPAGTSAATATQTAGLDRPIAASSAIAARQPAVTARPGRSDSKSPATSAPSPRWNGCRARVRSRLDAHLVLQRFESLRADPADLLEVVDRAKAAVVLPPLE